MKIAQLFAGARYLGKAKGDRQNYYIFDSEAGYLVVAPNSNQSFNMNLVDAEAPEAITRAFKGKRLTTGLLKKSRRRPDLFGTSFGCLNALYVMVGLGRARKLKLREGRSMVFKIR
jgi:hypothetical protein